MSNLYKELAIVYEAMYLSFINYQEEYKFYSRLLQKNGKKQLVEIGCGTGNLANYFHKNGFEYIGFDLSEDMLQLAQKKAPTCRFIKGDMRNFQLDNQMESIIITARTISYLWTNKEVNNAFSSFFRNIQKGGILCFDFIDANMFIPMVSDKKEITHKATFDGTNYIRKSTWELLLTHGMDFDWRSTYYRNEEDGLIEIGTDQASVRSFTLNEIEIFLSINGFAIKETINRPSYFFPTYVVVAERL